MIDCDVEGGVNGGASGGQCWWRCRPWVVIMVTPTMDGEKVVNRILSREIGGGKKRKKYNFYYFLMHFTCFRN